MIKLLIKHLIYEQAINAMFEGFIKNLSVNNNKFKIGKRFKSITVTLIDSYDTEEFDPYVEEQYKLINPTITKIHPDGIDVSCDEIIETYIKLSGLTDVTHQNNITYKQFLQFNEITEIVE